MNWLGNKVREFLASVRGDKMLLLIVILLYLFSITTVLSSTSMQVSSGQERIKMLIGQLATIILSGGLLYVIYKFCSLKGLMKFGVYGFLGSLLLLAFLDLHIRIPHFMESQNLNDSWRTVLFFGKVQIHVFEVVKIFSVMYMAWAVTTWTEDNAVYDENETDEQILADRRGFWRLRNFAWKRGIAWLEEPFFKRALFIYLPFLLTCAMVLPGSNSSMAIIALGMLVTLFVGGFGRGHLALFIIFCAVVGGGGLLLLNKLDAKGNRTETGRSRIEAFTRSYEDRLADLREEMKKGTKTRTDYDKFIDENRQVQGAKFAIREGGHPPFGKGPGGSTQKYKVMGMFSDFMFSFICEEYGLLGAIYVIFLFGCLIARGTRIANYCSSVYARTMVAGLVILISGQALIHILVNVGLMPMTGQTLPILSDGKSALVMFSIAFGVVLGVSRLVREEIEKEEV